MTTVKIKRVVKDHPLPMKSNECAACYDCYAALDHYYTLGSGERTLIPLGFALELPHGYEAIIRPRSGLSKAGLDACIGTIDEDYRGEVKACVVNNTGALFCIIPKMRICQLAIREVPPVEFSPADELSETERGSNGFGSTGL